MKDYWERAIKTFVQAFGGTLVPIIVGWLSDIGNIDWRAWYIWAIPPISSAFAAGIAAVWNYILESKKLEV